jgi:hypothetical protein
MSLTVPELTVIDIAGMIINTLVAYVIIIRNPQPISLLIPILAATSVLTGIIRNRTKTTGPSSTTLSDITSTLHVGVFFLYIVILLMRFSILETIGFTLVTGILTAILFAVTNLTLDRLNL